MPKEKNVSSTDLINFPNGFTTFMTKGTVFTDRILIEELRN